MQPNFVLMKLPGEPGMEFVEILPFTPANRNNLIGWIAGRSDGPPTAPRWSTISRRPAWSTDRSRSKRESIRTRSSRANCRCGISKGRTCRRGTLLVIPLGRALLYAEAIYLQAERSPMPELRLVVLAMQDRLAYAPTFEAALAALFGNGSPTVGPASVSAGAASGAPATSSSAQPAASHDALIGEAARDLADYQRLTAEGKLGEAGQKLEHLKSTLEKLNARPK